MSDIQDLLAALSQRTITEQVALPHDQARARYPLWSITVGTFDEFTQVISDYYNYHFSTCVSKGASLTASEASDRAFVHEPISGQTPHKFALKPPRLSALP